MGGYILLNAAIHHPTRFKALIICDTQCISDSAEAKKGRKETIEKIEAGGKAEFADGFLKKAFCKETIENNNALVDIVRDVVMSTNDVTISNTLRALAERSETCYALDKISIPTLILYGELDVITPKEQSVYMNAKIPQSILHSISNAGHLSNLENSSEFNRKIESFLSDIKK